VRLSSLIRAYTTIFCLDLRGLLVLVREGRTGGKGKLGRGEGRRRGKRRKGRRGKRTYERSPVPNLPVQYTITPLIIIYFVINNFT